MSQPEKLFTFRLALKLGLTRRELLEKLTSYELAQWMAFERIEPWGERRADLRAGIIASVVANANRTRQEPYKASDFMPNFKIEDETDEEEKQKELDKKVMEQFLKLTNK